MGTYVPEAWPGGFCLPVGESGDEAYTHGLVSPQSMYEAHLNEGEPRVRKEGGYSWWVSCWRQVFCMSLNLGVEF